VQEIGAIRDCLGPKEPPSRPAIAFPAGAWDTHFHVLGPQAKYPYAEKRKYTPPDAPLERALAVHDALGIARGLVVHANTHGFDNAVDLDAVTRSGGRYLAVVRLDASTTPGACEALHAAGARGVRFAFNPQHGGTLELATFDHVMRCIQGLGWFVELHFDGGALPSLQDWIASIAAPAAAVAGPLSLVSLRHEQGTDGTLVISGVVKNPSDSIARERLFAAASLLDKDGALVATARAPLDFTLLAPGEESPFVVRVTGAAGVARYRVGFRDDGGAAIPHLDRR